MKFWSCYLSEYIHTGGHEANRNKDFTATIAFDKATGISKIGFNCIAGSQAGICFPAALEVAVSNDGENFETIKII